MKSLEDQYSTQWNMLKSNLSEMKQKSGNKDIVAAGYKIMHEISHVKSHIDRKKNTEEELKHLTNILTFYVYKTTENHQLGFTIINKDDEFTKLHSYAEGKAKAWTSSYWKPLAISMLITAGLFIAVVASASTVTASGGLFIGLGVALTIGAIGIFSQTRKRSPQGQEKCINDLKSSCDDFDRLNGIG